MKEELRKYLRSIREIEDSVSEICENLDKHNVLEGDYLLRLLVKKHLRACRDMDKILSLVIEYQRDH